MESQPHAAHSPRRGLVSRRPARAAGGLLLVQGGLLVAATAYAGLQVDWAEETFGHGLSATAADTITSGTFFVILAGVAAVAAIGCLFVRRFAWLLAMIVQTLTLLASLILYFVLEPVYTYVLMLYAVIMVLYLNSSYVREAFNEPKLSDGGKQ